LAEGSQSYPTMFIPYDGPITLSKQTTIYSCINRIDNYVISAPAKAHAKA